MFKIILLLLCLTFSTSHAASFKCNYDPGVWGYIKDAYCCDVQNSLSITSLDAAQVDSVTGRHKPGHNNDNVDFLSIEGAGKVHYFPHGLDKIFKNLKGIQIYGTGLKQVRQVDLKDFPNLTNLYLDHNYLKILEKDLFKFNPNLEVISLYSNRITHIDPNVFDGLTKLKTLNLGSNDCINMSAVKNPTAVQNVIKTASTKCSNSDYLNLEQKVRNLEAESATLSSEQLKEKLQNLEIESQDLYLPYFFQQEIQDLKAVQVKKAQEEA
ncbi:peroxidasin homolog isoform X3 [Chironomus tepperi]|uniref:peroxidasin homolog isoform X2 n=1 Tax=Chironomus tepperi TaxID=113505 RepID=UPI00391F7AAC